MHFIWLEIGGKHQTVLFLEWNIKAQRKKNTQRKIRVFILQPHISPFKWCLSLASLHSIQRIIARNGTIFAILSCKRWIKKTYWDYQRTSEQASERAGSISWIAFFSSSSSKLNVCRCVCVSFGPCFCPRYFNPLRFLTNLWICCTFNGHSTWTKTTTKHSKWRSCCLLLSSIQLVGI